MLRMSAEARPGNVDTSSLDQFRSDDFFAGEELLVSRDEVPRQEIEMFAAIEEIFPQIPDKFKPALKTMMELVPAKFLERSLAMLNRVAAFENWQRFGKPVLPGAAEVARDLGAKVGEAYDQAARESKDLFFLVEELRNFLKIGRAHV